MPAVSPKKIPYKYGFVLSFKYQVEFESIYEKKKKKKKKKKKNP